MLFSLFSYIDEVLFVDDDSFILSSSVISDCFAASSTTGLTFFSTWNFFILWRTREPSFLSRNRLGFFADGNGFQNLSLYPSDLFQLTDANTRLLFAIGTISDISKDASSELVNPDSRCNPFDRRAKLNGMLSVATDKEVAGY